MTTAGIESLRAYVSARDPQAFEALVSAYGQMVYNVCLRLLGNPHDAEDATQESFVKLARHASSIRGNLPAWLHRCAVNQSLGMRRQRGRQDVREREYARTQAAQTNQADDEPAWADIEPHIDAALDALSDELRHILVAHFLDRQSQAQIAAETGLSPATISRRMKEGIERLRAELGAAAVAVPSMALPAMLMQAGQHTVPAALWTSLGKLSLASGSGLASTATTATSGAIWGWGVAALVVAGALVTGTVVALSGGTGATAPAVAAATASPTTVPAPQAAGSILVSVVAADTGRPVEGAQVRAQILPAYEPFASQSTDAQGQTRIRLGSVEPYELYILVSAPGYVTMRRVWDARRIEPVPSTYTISLTRGQRIGGILRTSDRKPVSGAKLQVYAFAPSTHLYSMEASPWVVSQNVTSDETGQWSFELAPPGVNCVWCRVWHPDYCLGDEVQHRLFNTATAESPSLADFQKGTAELVLQPAVAVHGVVRDDHGQPVADAEVALAYYTEDYHRTRTGWDGSFTLRGVRPGPTKLIAKAPGCGLVVQEVKVGQGMPEVAIRLRPGNVVRGRIVDGQGQPQAGAFVFISDENQPRVSDVEGRFAYAHAPTDIIEVSVSSLIGAANKVSLKADGGENVITVGVKRRWARGRVVDAASGAPVGAFRITAGTLGGGNMTEQIYRSSACDGRDGQFCIMLPQAQSEARDSWGRHTVLLVEAEGYYPLVTEEIAEGESDVALDVKLRRGQPMTGTVLAPDGKPAVGASVFVATSMESVSVMEGVYPWDGYAFHPKRPNSPPWTRTDEAGKFTLPPQDGKFLIGAVHDQGYAVINGDQRGDGTIRLMPWGRIEGMLRKGANPEPNVELRLESQRPYLRGEPAIYFDSMKTLKTDAQGHFAIERVPAGRHRVVRVESRQDGGLKDVMTFPSLEVRSGEVAWMSFGGSGLSVAGSVDVPIDPRTRKPLIYHFCELAQQAPPIDVPADFNAWPNERKGVFVQEWYEREGRNLDLRNLPRVRMPVTVKPDGSFVVQDVPPGAYALRMRAFEPPPAAEPQKEIGEEVGRAETLLVVTDKAGKRTVLPKLALEELGVLRPGQPAPPLEGQTPDQRAISLGDYRGTYVVLAFWATWCGPCMSEIEELRELQSRVGNDPRIVILSVSLDESADAWQRMIADKKMSWPQMRLGAWAENRALVDQWGVRGIPAVYLIDAEGMVIAKPNGANIESALKAAMERK